MWNNKNPYYLRRSSDRIAQAVNYLNDSLEFLRRAVQELQPITCMLCPKEAVYNFKDRSVCEEHASDEIKNATKVETKPAEPKQPVEMNLPGANVKLTPVESPEKDKSENPK